MQRAHSARAVLSPRFFLLWGERLPIGNWLRWIYELPSMESFRIARPSQYFKLLGVRLLIVLGAGFALYGQFVSFHIGISFGSDARIDAIHCGDRKFGSLTRRNRNNSVGVYAGLLPGLPQRTLCCVYRWL